MTESTFYPLCQSLSKSQKHEKKKQISSITSSKFHPRNRPPWWRVSLISYPSSPVRPGVFGWVSPGAAPFQLRSLWRAPAGLSSTRANRGSDQGIPNHPQRGERRLGGIARLAHDVQRTSGRK